MGATPEALRHLASRRPVMALLAIVVVAAALRVVLFRGYVGLDDAEYAGIAYEMAEGSYRVGSYAGPPVFPLRIGVIAPTALSFKLFGLGEWASVAYPFLVSLASLALVYVCAGVLFGPVGGVLAAALLAVMPQDVEMATKLLPDMPAAFFGAFGVTVLVAALSASAQTSAWWGLLAGVFFGASWLHKEAVAYLVPFVGGLLIVTIRRRGRTVVPLWMGVAAGSLAILLGEMAAYWATAGDPLFRLHETERNYAELGNAFFTEGSNLGWREGESRAAALARRLFVTGPRVLLLNPGQMYLPVVGLMAAFVGFRSRPRDFLIPGAWLASLLLMFNFASSSTTSYMPLAIAGSSRYVYATAYPAVILVAGLVAVQLPALRDALRARRFPGRALPAVLAGGVVLCSGLWQLQYPMRHLDEVQWWTAEVRALSERVSPDVQLYADTLSLRGLSFFGGYPSPVGWTDFERLPVGATPEAGSLVLVNPNYINWLEVNAGMWLSGVDGYRKHDFYVDAPSAWTTIWDNGTTVLYRVDGA